MSAAIRGLCLAESTRPTHTVGNKPTPPAGLGSRLIKRKKGGEGKSNTPSSKGYQAYSTQGLCRSQLGLFSLSLHMLCVTGSVVGKHIHTWPLSNGSCQSKGFLSRGYH